MPYDSEGWYPRRSRRERPPDNYTPLLVIIGLLVVFVGACLYGAGGSGGL